MHFRSVASLKFKNRLNVFKKGTYTNNVDPDETPQNVASHHSLHFLPDKHTIIKFVYDQAIIHFVLIGDKSSKGAYKGVIPTSSQILSKLDLE